MTSRVLNRCIVSSVYLSHTQNDLDGQLIQFLVAVATLRQLIDIERGGLQFLYRLLAVAAQQTAVGLVTSVEFLQKGLDFGVGVEALDFGLEHIVGAHAAQGEVPYALLVLSTVGVRVEVAWPVVA